MWIVVVYVCLSNAACIFIDSPPVYTSDECEKLKVQVDNYMNNDPRVIAYDKTCVHVRMRES
jgi:hypothetical protein